MKEWMQTEDSALGARRDSMVLSDLRTPNSFAPETDIIASQFSPGQFSSGVSGVRFSDQSIEAETQIAPCVEEDNEPMIDDSPAYDSKWESSLAFAESFSAPDEPRLIETILPVRAAPVPETPAQVDEPTAMTEQAAINAALTRISQIRKALFGASELSPRAQSG